MQRVLRFFGRMRGEEPCSARHNLAWVLWSWLGAFIGIALVGYAQRLVPLAATDHIFLVGSFGASAVLIYGTPQVPYAQPRNLVGGHVISALIGVTVAQYWAFPIEIQAALAVSLSIALMHLTRTLHPPGGATALIAVLGSPQIHQLGFEYIIRPILSGVLIMLLVALIINNLSRDRGRHYPRCWW